MTAAVGPPRHIVALAAVGALPENDQSTLGWLYVVCGVAALGLLTWATSGRLRTNTAVTQHDSSPSMRE
ncbi:hypothetical protein [Mycobacterium antarcticum]|uniref:hypothetical protein n=1 Tax=Mycolicibacterium sp. TUM20983 TaxID=3023369 RepID=UPI0024E15027|nr:hypothetical protein [Mycolicibacterium sp. TUM20983]